MKINLFIVTPCSFNEPTSSSQANMAPAEAAQQHIRLMNSFAGRVLIGASAVSSSPDTQGLGWLAFFFVECHARGGCAVDFCNLHWCSDSRAMEAMFRHLDDAHRLSGSLPLWLTEFAVTGTDQDVGLGSLSV